MIRTTRSQMSQLFCIARIHEPEHFRKIAEVSNQTPDAGNSATQERKNIEREISAIVQGFVPRPAKQPSALLFDVAHNELSQQIDNRNRILVTFLLRFSPGKEAMTAQHYPIAVPSLLH